jgi:hypothetical protein
MRPLPTLLLAASLTLVGCDGNPPTDETPTDGTLVVSTSTVGDDSDTDSYLLMVDEADSFDLVPTGTAEVDLPPGRHTLRLLGVAGHCTVGPATPFEVDVPSGSTTRVTFKISCPVTGARVTVTTTGGDLDLNGYIVEVDGTDRGDVGPNGALVVRLDPGSRTIALSGLAPNCTIDGPASRTVTIVDHEVVPIEFAVVCTGSRTIRLEILSRLSHDLTLTGYIHVQITLDGKVHDIQVPSGSSTFYFGGLGRGMVDVQAQLYSHAWVRCQRHPGWNGPPVSTIEADTAEVGLELVSTVHCHFH